MQNRVIAFLDNDTAAYVAKKGLANVKLPSNVVLMHYPELPLANSYPTLGPTGNQQVNINGLAGSIELYLGEDVLRSNGELIPIQWREYDKTLEKYQGELLDKVSVQEKYRRKLEKCELNAVEIQDYDWSGIHLILKSMFGAFQS